jgi:hypothetical protein
MAISEAGAGLPDFAFDLGRQHVRLPDKAECFQQAANTTRECSLS